MTLDWDRTALDVLAGTAARSLARSSLGAMQDAAGPGVQLKVDGASIVSDPAGAEAEYNGTPWVSQGIKNIGRPRVGGSGMWGSVFPYNSVDIVAPATTVGYVENHQNHLVNAKMTYIHFINGGDMALPDLNIGYHVADPNSTGAVLLTTEKLDGSGDTEAWTTCLTRVQLFKSLRPNCQCFVDVTTLRGYNVDHTGAAQTAAIADLDSADAQTYFAYLKAQNIVLCPQTFPYTTLIGGTSPGNFVSVLCELYRPHVGGVTFAPIVSRRKLPPMWTGDPDLLTFYSSADWQASERAMLNAGCWNRIIFDSPDSDAVVAQYASLLTSEYA